MKFKIYAIHIENVGDENANIPIFVRMLVQETVMISIDFFASMIVIMRTTDAMDLSFSLYDSMKNRVLFHNYTISTLHILAFEAFTVVD